jgi:hypothetical protein
MNYPVTKTLLALGCAGTLAATASAQLPTTYSSGDFLVGFREVGVSTSVVVDIGNISTFNFNTPMVFAIDEGTNLSTEYGASFASNANVYFSLAETDSADNTSYVTSPSYLLGINAGPAKDWSRLTNTNANILQGKINSFGSEFTNRGQLQPNTDPNAYQNYMPGGTTDAGHATSGNIAFGYFNPTTEGNFGQTTAGVELTLVELPPGSGPGTELGNFQLSPDGNTLTYTPEVIPEPSSVAAAALGVLALLGFFLNKARKSSRLECVA